MKSKTFTTVSFIILFCASFIANIFADPIIIESRDGGQNTQYYKETAGSWSDSVAKSLVEGVTPGIGSRFCIIDNPPNTSSFEISPFIPSAGKYEIFATWGTSGNAENCKYSVIINGVESQKVYLNQRGWGSPTQPDTANGNVWVSIGVFDLPQGQGVKIVGSADEIKGKADERNSGRFYSDAIKIIPAGSEGSTQTGAQPQTSTASQQSSPFSQTQEQQPQNSQFTGNQSSQTTQQTSDQPLPASPFQASGTQQTQTTPQATQAGGWMTDYSQAIQEGTRQNKPILLFFYSEMGRLSMQMENQILGNATVQPYLQKYILCKVLITDQNNVKLSEYYEVFKAPTLVFLNPQGYMKGREDKSIDTQAMINLLDKMK